MNLCQSYGRYIRQKAKDAGGGSGELTISTFGEFTANQFLWSDAILAPNGYIYGIPLKSPQIIKIDPSTDTYTTFGDLSQDTSNKYYSGALGPNGYIYAYKYGGGDRNVLKIDTNTDTITLIPTPGTSAGGGGVLAANNCIYFMPYNGIHILKLNTETDEYIEMGEFTTKQGKWFKPVLAPNGCIYCPGRASILKIDPSTDEYTTFGEFSDDISYRFLTSVLAPNGHIYGVPYSSLSVIKVDPSTDTYTTFGLLSEQPKCTCGFLMSDNCIYGIPTTGTNIVKIDTVSDTVSIIDSAITFNCWGGGMSNNGGAYIPPYNNESIIKITI